VEVLKEAKKSIRKGLIRTGIVDPFRTGFKDLEFETTAYCNRKCTYCPQSVSPRHGNQEGRYMPEEIFKKLISDLKVMNYKGLIAPHLYGEPMSDTRLASWIKHIKEELPGTQVKVVTNGDYLNKNSYQELVQAGVDYFHVSKHSDHLAKGAVELFESLSERERKKRIIVLDYYEDYRSKQELLNSRGGQIDLKKEKRHPESCIYVAYPVIDTFGNIILCCNDYDSKYVSGNIMERSLIEIWKDPKNIKFRKRIFEGNMDLPICQNCWI